MSASIWILPLLPLSAFLLNGLLGKWLKAAAAWYAAGVMILAAILSVTGLLRTWCGGVELPLETGPLWTWMKAGNLELTIGLRYDQLTAVMCSIICFVGSLVFVYALEYMKGDPGYNRFFAYLSLFVFAMLILVLGDSFPLLFVGWEGVGLCSYLLIGYYYEAPGAPDAGKKAFVVNRVGDAGFLLAMFLIFKYTGTLNIQEALKAAPEAFAYGGAAITAVGLLFLLGCSGKSAQIPLFIWLPDAMAGPTPVSALIHAATMVTAGVYLACRASLLFAMAPAAMAAMATIGALTAFVAGSSALTQRDIKKVLAYSTVSQLGYMFLACGVGAFEAGIFHVGTHAFFKACLFLGAGAVIHAAGGKQDLFQMGGLKKELPAVWLTYGVSCLAIAGFPLTAGFFSKDEILWRTFASGHIVLYLLGLATALMTAVYSFRAFFLAFHGKSRLPAPIRHHIHHPGFLMKAPLAVLALGALFAGFLNVPEAFGGSFAFDRFLEPVLGPALHVMHEHAADYPHYHNRAAELLLAGVSIVLALGGIGLAVKYSLRQWPNAPGELASRFAFVHQLSARRWWWDEACGFVFGRGTNLLARGSVLADRGLIDAAVLGLGRVAREGGRIIRNLQAGHVQAYALAVFAGVNILLLVVLLFP